MIDIQQVEELIRLADATELLPRLRRGRKVNVSTLHRWATHGLRGVVLETTQCGGTKCTTRAALQRFFSELARAAASTSAAPNSHDDAPVLAHEAERVLRDRWTARGRRGQSKVPDRLSRTARRRLLPSSLDPDSTV